MWRISMNETKNEGLSISTKSFITAISVIFVLMIAAYIMTLVIPGGIYERVLDANGNLQIDPGTFTSVSGGIPFWKWVLSPILVLGATGNGTLIAVIAFLLVIGGIFNALDKSRLMKYMLDKITFRFQRVRYRLLMLVTLFFMALGAMIGSFEECVPLVPIVVALAIHLGWDALTGIGMSLLAVGCGFASGVCNPFTVGVAQQLAGLPMFSGIWMRLLSFLLIYLLLLTFLLLYAKKIDKGLTVLQANNEFHSNRRMDRALLAFCSILGFGILLILCAAVIPSLQDYTMIIVAVMFMISGIVSCLLSGMSGKQLLVSSWSGVTGILPAVAMILMASSIKFTLEEAQVLDTLLHSAMTLAAGMSKWAVILFIYLLVLVMNFFISSGSAKAFMLIPLIIPLAQIFDISPQLCILAFAFGDGFSNVFYPTNPVLLISLGLVNVSYGKWVSWSWKFQALNLLLTSSLLLLSLWIGY